jgi:hydrogenase maturation protease
MTRKNTKTSILILGIGNDILSDDGIGPRIVRDLDKAGLPLQAVCREATLGGLELLDLVKDFDEVILVDALKTGIYAPGTVHQFIPADFEETLHLSSIHDIDFLTSLELGRRTGMKIPARITIIAVEIIEDRVFSSEFTPVINMQYPEILSQVQEKIEKILSE